MSTLSTLQHRIERGIGSVTSALFVLMLLLTTLQVVLRLVFNEGIAWVDPLARRLMLWIGLLGAVLCTAEGKHFRIEVLEGNVPLRTKRVLEWISGMFSAIVCLALAGASVSYLLLVSPERDHGIGDVPLAVVAAIIPIAYLLLAGQFVLRTLAHDDEVALHGSPAVDGGEQC
jgi:TRAP-type C4-dicarboxylate transport system permease small subunit